MFTVNRKLLAAELALLSVTAEKKATMPILSTIKFEFNGNMLTLTATDIDMTIITQIEASGESWAGCVPSKQLYELVRLFNSDEVDFKPEANNRIHIQWGKSRHKLPFFPASDFPATDHVQVDKLVTLDGSILNTAITRALKCISADAKEFWMQGVSLCSRDGYLLVTGTNSRNLATTSIATALDVDLILPTRAASALVKFLDGEVEVGASQNQAIFRQGSKVFITRLLDAKFPDWRPLVPVTFKHSFPLPAESTSQAFRLVAVTAKESQLIPIPLKLTLSNNEMVVETKDSEIGQSTESLAVNCPTLNGDSLTTGINGQHFIAFLDAETKPVLAFNDDLKLFQLTVEGDPGYRYITMVLKV